MTTLTSILTTHLLDGRTLKERAFAAGEESIDPQVCVYRGNRLIGRAVVAAEQATDVELVAALMMWGLDGSTLVCTFEGWHTRAELNPLSGRRWEPGDIEQQIAIGAIPDGLAEHVMCIVLDRERPGVVGSQPFRVTDDGTLEWGEVREHRDSTFMLPLEGAMTEVPGKMSPDIRPVYRHLPGDSEEVRAALDALVMDKVQEDFPAVLTWLACEPWERKRRAIVARHHPTPVPRQQSQGQSV